MKSRSKVLKNKNSKSSNTISSVPKSIKTENKKQTKPLRDAHSQNPTSLAKQANKQSKTQIKKESNKKLILSEPLQKSYKSGDYKWGKKHKRIKKESGEKEDTPKKKRKKSILQLKRIVIDDDWPIILHKNKSQSTTKSKNKNGQLRRKEKIAEINRELVFWDKVVENGNGRRSFSEAEIDYIKMNSDKLEAILNYFLGDNTKNVEDVILASFNLKGGYTALKEQWTTFNEYLYNYYLTQTKSQNNKHHQNIKLVETSEEFPSIDTWTSVYNQPCYLITNYVTPSDFTAFTMDFTSTEYKSYSIETGEINNSITSLDLSCISKEVVLHPLNASSDWINKFELLIPNEHLPSNKANFLKYSPVQVNGITDPLLISLSPIHKLDVCFKSRWVQFRRYIWNLGPGNIVHYVTKPINNTLAFSNFRIVDHKYNENITYYCFLQKPGDVAIIESNSLHEGRIETDRTSLITWSMMSQRSIDIMNMINIQKGIIKTYNQSQMRRKEFQAWRCSPYSIPVNTWLLNYLSKNIENITVDKDILKIMFIEISAENIRTYREALISKGISIIEQPKSEKIKINWCDYCFKEIFNYWSFNKYNSKIQCIDCYIDRFVDFKSAEVLFCKYKANDLNELYLSLQWQISNNYINNMSIQKRTFTDVLGEYNAYGVNRLVRGVVDGYWTSSDANNKFLFNWYYSNFKKIKVSPVFNELFTNSSSDAILNNDYDGVFSSKSNESVNFSDEDDVEMTGSSNKKVERIMNKGKSLTEGWQMFEKVKDKNIGKSDEKKEVMHEEKVNKRSLLAFLKQSSSNKSKEKNASLNKEKNEEKKEKYNVIDIFAD